jgi:ABC-2 type transport system permease protein
MSPFLPLVGKQLAESRWFLGLVVLALFGMGWLGAYQTRSLLAMQNETGRARGQFMARMLGGPAYDNSVLAMEVARWNTPIIPLLVICWAIARGSSAVAGELERGTMDVVLSRPVSRFTYLMAQVFSALLGLVIMVAFLIAGTLIANGYYAIENAPGLVPMLRPGLNLLTLGASVFGYTIVLSSFDVVRWRANLIGSALTIGGLIGYLVANSEEMKDDWGWLEWLTVFKGYAPVEAAVKGEELAANAGALGGVALAGIVLAYLCFQGRDLPTNS